MNDVRDLVERLRKNDARAQFTSTQKPPFSIQGEAADEIERLRAARPEEKPIEVRNEHGYSDIGTALATAGFPYLEPGTVVEPRIPDQYRVRTIPPRELPRLEGMTFESDCIVNGMLVPAGTKVKFEWPPSPQKTPTDG